MGDPRGSKFRTGHTQLTVHCQILPWNARIIARYYQERKFVSYFTIFCHIMHKICKNTTVLKWKSGTVYTRTNSCKAETEHHVIRQHHADHVMPSADDQNTAVFAYETKRNECTVFSPPMALLQRHWWDLELALSFCLTTGTIRHRAGPSGTLCLF